MRWQTRTRTRGRRTGDNDSANSVASSVSGLSSLRMFVIILIGPFSPSDSLSSALLPFLNTSKLAFVISLSLNSSRNWPARILYVALLFLCPVVGTNTRARLAGCASVTRHQPGASSKQMFLSSSSATSLRDAGRDVSGSNKAHAHAQARAACARADMLGGRRSRRARRSSNAAHTRGACTGPDCGQEGAAAASQSVDNGRGRTAVGRDGAAGSPSLPFTSRRARRALPFVLGRARACSRARPHLGLPSAKGFFRFRGGFCHEHVRTLTERSGTQGEVHDTGTGYRSTTTRPALLAHARRASRASRTIVRARGAMRLDVAAAAAGCSLQAEQACWDREGGRGGDSVHGGARTRSALKLCVRAR